MTTITLGTRPKSFKRVVHFPMLDGTPGSLEVSYKYRTRSEFGAFVDGIVSKAQAEQAQAEQSGKTPQTLDDLSMTRIMTKTAQANAAYLLDVLDGWGLDVPLNAENVGILTDQYPAATMAIMEAYRAAITEGRLGN